MKLEEVGQKQVLRGENELILLIMDTHLIYIHKISMHTMKYFTLYQKRKKASSSINQSYNPLHLEFNSMLFLTKR